jgi:hypothetical protein
MKRVLLFVGTFLFAVIAAVAIAGFIRFNFTDGGDIVPASPPAAVTDVTVTIDDQRFTMSNGVAETPSASGSAVKNTIRLVGEPVMGDADGDGDLDAALMIQNEPGGSGTFYYAVVALDNEGVYRASNALLLGDRIEPQTVEFTDGRFAYTYAERRADEPMAAHPSVEKTVLITIDTSTGVISAS